MVPEKPSQSRVDNFCEARELASTNIETIIRATEDLCSSVFESVKSFKVRTRALRETDADGDVVFESHLRERGP